VLDFLDVMVSMGEKVIEVIEDYQDEKWDRFFFVKWKLSESNSKGNQGSKEEVGYIQQVDLNSTRFVLIGPPGLQVR
jgi:hypothetical protein